MTCNDKSIVDQGYLKSPSKLNETQRLKFGVNNHASFKLVPYAVKLYNRNMNSIDVIDQSISSYDRHQRDFNLDMPLIQSSIKKRVAACYKIYQKYLESIGKNPWSIMCTNN